MVEQIFTLLFGRKPSSDMTPRQMAGHIIARLAEKRAGVGIELGHSYDAPHVITSIRVNDMDYHAQVRLDEFLETLGIGPDVQDAINALRATGSFSILDDLDAQNKRLNRALKGMAQTMSPAPIPTSEQVQSL